MGRSEIGLLLFGRYTTVDYLPQRSRAVFVSLDIMERVIVFGITKHFLDPVSRLLEITPIRLIAFAQTF